MKQTVNSFEDIKKKNFKVENHMLTNNYDMIMNNIEQKGYMNYAEYLAELECKKAMDLQREKEEKLNSKKTKIKEYLNNYKDKDSELDESKLKHIQAEDLLKKKKDYTKGIKLKSKQNINKCNNSNTNIVYKNDKVISKTRTNNINNENEEKNEYDNYQNNPNNYDFKNENNNDDFVKNEEFENNDFEFIVDVKSNLEDLVVSQKLEMNSTNIFKNNLKDNVLPLSHKQIFSDIQNHKGENSNININENVDKQIEYGIKSIKEFRKRGVISELDEETPNNSMLIPQPQSCSNLNSNNNKSKIFKNELEKRRYVKALKNIMIEKFSEKKIIVPNICSCGQLQKKLDTLLEKGNVSVLSIVNTECANNCIYYKNNKEYKKALNDIISSIKNIKFESFY